MFLRQIYYNVYDYGRLVGSYATMDIQTMLHCGRRYLNTARQMEKHTGADIHSSG